MDMFCSADIWFFAFRVPGETPLTTVRAVPNARVLCEPRVCIFHIRCDAGWHSDTSTPRPISPPSGPITRARVKVLHDEVNSFLTILDLGTPLDGMLPHADVLCVIRYKEHQDPERTMHHGQGKERNSGT
jgi:hypothetical protein